MPEQLQISKEELKTLPFKVGDKVKNRYNDDIGQVAFIEKLTNGYILFNVRFKDGRQRPYEAFELSAG